MNERNFFALIIGLCIGILVTGNILGIQMQNLEDELESCRRDNLEHVLMLEQSTPYIVEVECECIVECCNQSTTTPVECVPKVTPTPETTQLTQSTIPVRFTSTPTRSNQPRDATHTPIVSDTPDKPPDTPTAVPSETTVAPTDARPARTPTPVCKPGWGHGDRNHCHDGPPGRRE